MGIITLILLLSLEAFLLAWSIKTKNNLREEKGIISISLLLLYGLLLATGVFEWSLRHSPLLLVLSIQAILGIVLLAGKREKEYTLSRSILRFAKNSLIFTLAMSLLILFPPYEQPKATGSYEVARAKYTWTDKSRVEQFSQSDEKRALTVEFWYPQNTHKTYPLVVFSHGAFGFSGSNYSTFMELASKGYVIASIGHTYQAFYTMDTKGKLTLVDSSFINKAVEINGIVDTSNEEDIYKTTHEWMKLRTADEHFVINSILENSIKESADPLFSVIDHEKIGLIGHSLGGASSAQIGRERDDIDAVVVLDGTMLGEEIAFENNEVVLNDTPYPVPLLNIYAQDHYSSAKDLAGDSYNNFYASQNAVCAYETVFKNAGHLNFTDLPLFSPALAKILGVGTIDEAYCIDTMNKVVLEFFDSYLKGAGVATIEKEY